MQHEKQETAPNLLLSDLSTKKSVKEIDLFVHTNSTFERASQDAGYFATGKGEVCVDLKIEQ